MRGWPEFHEPKPPGVIVGHLRPAREFKHDVIMARIGSRFMVELANFRVRNGKAPRHAKMHDENLIRGQGEREKLRLSSKMCDARAREALSEPLRKRKPQISAILAEVQNLLPFHDWGKSAANCLDFG